MAVSEAKIRIAMEGASVVLSEMDKVNAGLIKLQSAGGMAAKALGALGVAFSAQQIVEHIKGIIDTADAMNDMSQRVGIAIQDLAKYELATKQSGTTMEALAKGIKGISTNLTEHGDALKKAGLSATTADGAMRQLADLFKAMPDGLEKTALAVKMFGKSGMDLIPMLNMGSEGLKEAADKSAKYAATMVALAPQADKFNDNMAELGMLTKLASMNLAVDMVDALIAVSRAMIDTQQKGQGFWETMNAGIWAFENEASKHLPGIFESYATAMPRQIANLKNELADLQSEKGALKLDLFGVGPKIDAEISATIKALAAAEEAYKKYLLTVNGPSGGDKGGSATRPNTAVADWKAQYKAMMDAIKDTGGVKEAASEYDKLIKKLGTEVTKAAADAEAAQHGYNKAQTEFLALAGSDVWAKLTNDERAQVAALFESKIASEQLTDATKDRTKADLDAATARDKFNTSLSDGQDKMQADTLALQEQYDRLGLTKEAIAALDAAKLESQAVTLELLAIKMLDKNLDEVQYNLYKAQSAELRAQAALKGQIATKEAGIDTAKKVSEEWQRGWDETDRIAREAFTGWAENGVSMAETIGKSLKKAMLSAIYEATIKPIAFSIYSNVTGGAGGAGALSQAGSAAGIYNAGSSLGFIGAGTSAFSAGASLQAAGMGTEAFAAGVEMMTSATGASSFMAGAGQALGAIGPVGWAALAAIAVLSLQDHGTPTQNTGNASASFDAAGNRTAYQTYFGGSSANTDAMIGNMQLAYLAGAKSLGINAAATNFSYGSNTGKDSQNPMFALSGGSGASSYSLGETAYSDAAVSLAASRAVLAALKGSELPGYLSQLFNSVTVDTMTQDQITNTLAFASGLKQVREALLETREPLQILQDNVATGFATLATSADTFKHDFVAAIDAGVNPANLAAWQALATTMDQLAAATEAANVALATSRSAVLGASEKVSSVLRSIGNDVKAFADAASTAHDNLVGARLNISEALWSAQDRVIELQRQAADGLRTFAASIDDFLNTINPATSSGASLTMLKARLSATAVLASGGDTGAQGQLISQAQEVLKAAEASSTDRVQYARSEAFVRSTLEQVQKTTVTQQAELVATLITSINTSGMNIAHSLGLTGAAAETLAGLLQSTGTSSQTLSVLLAEPGAQAGLLATALGLTGTQATTFIGQLGNSGAAADLLGGNFGILSGSVETAQADLKKATDDVAAYTLLAQTTGATTDRSTRLVAGSVAELANAYGAALVANTTAQANYAEALRVTNGLQLTASGSFDALIKDLADLSTANSTFSTSIATFVTDSKTAGLNIATSLGLTGTAATTLAGLLNAPGTAATTLATLLGDPKGNMDALVTSLGLTGTAATAFKTALTGFNPGTLIGNQLGLAGTALTNFATLVNSIRITAPTVTPPVTALPVTTTGGALAGVQTVSMPDAVGALTTAVSTGASAAQIVNAANMNLGVSATDMALVGTAAGNTDIVAAANYANTDIVARGGLIGTSQSITVATLQRVLTELSPSYTAAQLITAAQTNWGVSEEDVRAVGKSLSLPGYRVGTNAVPFDMTARIHAGEEITPRPFVDMQRASRDETNDLLRRLVASNAELKAEVTALKKSNEATQKATEKTSETLTFVTRGGRAIQTEAFV